MVKQKHQNKPHITPNPLNINNIKLFLNFSLKTKKAFIINKFKGSETGKTKNPNPKGPPDEIII